MTTSIFFDLTSSLPQNLASSIAKDNTFLKSQLLELCTKEKWQDFIHNLIQPCLAVFKDDNHPLDPEMVFSLIFSLIRRIQILADREQITIELLTALSSYTQKPQVTIRILSSFYFASEFKYSVFVSLAKFVALIGGHEQALDLEGGLELTGNQPLKVREVNLVLSQAFQKSHPKKSQQYLVSYLSTFQLSEASMVTNQAKECAVNAIRDPLLARDYEILSLPAIQQLSKSDEKLFSLLTIVCTQSIKELAQFLANNPNSLESLGLKKSLVEEKMCLLSFTSLASSSNAEFLTYAQVALALDVDKSQVESWVIRAISAKVIDCKMDQEKEIIIVSSVAQRAFTASQWKDVALQLKKWKLSVRGVLQTVETAREEKLAVRGE